MSANIYVHSVKAIKFIRHTPDNAHAIELHILHGDDQKLDLVIFDLPIETIEKLKLGFFEQPIISWCSPPDPSPV